MHQNPFTPGGYDYSHLERQLHEKADRHEIHSLRSNVDSLERAVRELRTEIDGLRLRCEIVEESIPDAIREYHEANGQFGVGA